MASEPYSEERGPRTISMRAIWSTGICSSAGRPALTEPRRTPSTSTRVWVELVPRRNSEVCWPMPPLLARLTPGRPVSRSPSDAGCRRAMSARVSTITGARVSSSDTSVRVAVTTTGARSVDDGACGAVEHTAQSGARARISAPERRMDMNVLLAVRPARRHAADKGGSGKRYGRAHNPGEDAARPPRPPRSHRTSAAACRGRESRAGLRARRRSPARSGAAAFPCPSGTVADGHSADIPSIPARLTVAGAAPDLHRLPVSFRSGLDRAEHPKRAAA